MGKLIPLFLPLLMLSLFNSKVLAENSQSLAIPVESRVDEHVEILIDTLETLKLNSSANTTLSQVLAFCFSGDKHPDFESEMSTDEFTEFCENNKVRVRQKIKDLYPKMKMALSLSKPRMRPESAAFGEDEKFSWVYKITPKPKHPHSNIASTSIEWLYNLFSGDLALGEIQELTPEELEQVKTIYRQDTNLLENKFKADRSEYIARIDEIQSQLTEGFHRGESVKSQAMLEYYQEHYSTLLYEAKVSYQAYHRNERYQYYKNRYLRLVGQAPFLLYLNSDSPSDEELAKIFSQIKKNSEYVTEKLNDQGRKSLEAFNHNKANKTLSYANQEAADDLLHYIAFSSAVNEVVGKKPHLRESSEYLQKKFQRQEMWGAAMEAGGLITLHVAAFVLSGGTSLVINLFLGFVDIGYLAYTSSEHLDTRDSVMSAPLEGHVIADINRLSSSSKMVLFMSILTPIGVTSSTKAAIHSLKPESRAKIMTRWQDLVDGRKTDAKPKATDVVTQIESTFKRRTAQFQNFGKEAIESFVNSMNNTQKVSELAQEVIKGMEKVKKPFRWGVHDEAWGSTVSLRQTVRRSLGKLGNGIPEFPSKYLMDNTILIAEEVAEGARGLLLPGRRAQADALIESYFRKQGTDIPDDLNALHLEELAKYSRELDLLPDHQLPREILKAMDEY